MTHVPRNQAKLPRLANQANLLNQANGATKRQASDELGDRPS